MTKPPVGGNRTGRKLGQKVKKGKLKASSRRWIERHINDPYVQRAQLEGYRARAAFKLLEIDEKHKILAGAKRIIDLGAAPGSWSQIAAKVTDSNDADPRVAAIDFLEMDPLPGVHILQLDFLDPTAPEKLVAAVGGTPDLVMSDMAPNISGVDAADQASSMYLVELALDMSRQVLKPGGNFVTKVFHGEGYDDYVKEVRTSFDKVIVRKPDASRARSREVYLVGRGFKG